jgi:hypothetical protein
MSLRNCLRRFAGFLCGVSLLAARAHADDLSSSAPAKPPPLQVSIATEHVPNLLPAFRAYLTAGTNKFAFLVPAGFRMDISGEDGFSLVSADYRCWLTFRIAGPVPPGAKELKPGACRELLLIRRPGAKILEEFSLAAAGQRGPAFSLQWKGPSGVSQSARAVFIPSPAGVLEFGVFASPDNLPKFHGSFNTLLNTFCIGVGGKLEISPLSSKT